MLHGRKRIRAILGRLFAHTHAHTHTHTNMNLWFEAAFGLLSISLTYSTIWCFLNDLTSPPLHRSPTITYLSCRTLPKKKRLKSIKEYWYMDVIQQVHQTLLLFVVRLFLLPVISLYRYMYPCFSLFLSPFYQNRKWRDCLMPHNYLMTMWSNGKNRPCQDSSAWPIAQTVQVITSGWLMERPSTPRCTSSCRFHWQPSEICSMFHKNPTLNQLEWTKSVWSSCTIQLTRSPKCGVAFPPSGPR